MRIRIVALCIGAMLATLLPLPWMVVLWTAAVRSCLLALAGIPGRGVWLSFSAGVVLVSGLCFWHSQQVLPKNLEGLPIRVEGVVTGLPDYEWAPLQRSRFEFQPLLADWGEGMQPVTHWRRLRLSWYGGETVVPGQRWRLTVKLKRPRGLANSAGFDYELWLRQQGFYATGYVRKSPAPEFIGLERSSVWLSVLRARLSKHLSHLLADSDHGNLFQALVLGYRAALTDQDWALLSATGTNHLLVVSGLHIGLLAVLGHTLGRALSRCLPLSRGASLVGAVLAVGFSIGYSLLAGFSLPTQRAVIMVLAVITARQLGFRWPVTSSFVLALAVVLLWQPLVVTGASFWLSFGAVAILLLVFAGRLGQPAWHQRWLTPQWLVCLGLSPLLLLWVNQASWVAPLANLVAVPLFTLVIIPGALFATCASLIHAGAGQWLFLRLDQLLSWLWQGAEALQATSWPILWQAQPRALVVACAMLGVVLLCLPRGFPGRRLVPLFFLPLIVPGGAHPGPGQVKAQVLDVGQGLSVLVETRNHRLLYDTGGKRNSGFDLAEAAVLPQLRHQGVTALDMLVVSHGDRDHAGGLATLLQNLTVDQLLAGQPVSGGGESTVLTQQPCAERRWRWDGVVFQFLNAPGTYAANANNASCVLRIQGANGSLLLTGDIESGKEQALVQRYGDRLQSEVLVVPHHGSRSSSTQAFLSAVAPDYAVVSAGDRNPFRHPHPMVVQRYQALGIEILNTAELGMVSLWPTTDVGWRSQRRHGWRPWYVSDALPW